MGLEIISGASEDRWVKALSNLGAELNAPMRIEWDIGLPGEDLSVATGKLVGVVNAIDWDIRWPKFDKFYSLTLPDKVSGVASVFNGSHSSLYRESRKSMNIKSFIKRYIK